MLPIQDVVNQVQRPMVDEFDELMLSTLPAPIIRNITPEIELASLFSTTNYALNSPQWL